MRLGDWTPTWTCPVPIQHCCITCPHQATLAAVIVISAWQLQVLLLCCFSRRRDGWCMHPQSNMLSAATAVEYQWQLVQLQSQASSWAAWYNTRLLIESTPKGVVFSFLFFSFLFFSFHKLAAAYPLVTWIWKQRRPPIKAANLASVCLPQPPTPTSMVLPLGWASTRAMLQMC